jgi:beta-glucanase (GH16 family)
VTYYNYLGQPMPETAPEDSNILGTSAGGETIRAPEGNSSAAGAGGGDTMIGSSGDNTFFITDPHDVVLEQAGGGVDTENGWLTIKLAPNVENLVVHQNFNHGVGNDLDNLIITDGRAWLYGGAGNDVLVGATNTTTTFVEHAGEGNDVIYNWLGGSSQLQLTGYDFKTAADVRAAMTQSGDDVVLHLSSSETLTFRDVSLSDATFQDKQFLLPLDRSVLGGLTFDDEFDTLSIYDPSTETGTWNVDFGGNLKDQSAYTILANNEMELYTHEGMEGLGSQNLHLDPFSVSNGVLSITAEPIPQDQASAAFGHTYSSGMLNTLGSFEQKYGYWELKAQLPNAEGTWPAFWTIPWPYRSGQEGDVMESIGLKPDMDSRRAYGATDFLYDDALKLDPNGWHTYGMLWTQEKVAFYLDGVEVAEGPTPTGWTDPVGMILNLAVGGWGGEANPDQFPATMNVDYLRVYALADGSSEVTTGTPAAPYATIQEPDAPGSTTAQPLTFDDTGAALSSAKIVLLTHEPTAADIPASGRAFVVWEAGGQVRGAVSNDGYLDTPTTLAAGSVSQFTGEGTFLTDGRVVLAHTGDDAGQTAVFSMIFDPSTHTVQDHELGVGSGQASIVALDDGNFAASWHTADGAIEGRAYNAYAYDAKGWWGPVRDLSADATGVDAQGQLITGDGQHLYSITPYSPNTATSVSIGDAQVSHAEGSDGLTTYTFTISRSEWNWERATVAWKVEGFGANPATAADFAGGWMPSGVVTLQGDTTSATVTIQVAGDAAAEPDEQFQVTLLNPVGAQIGTATAVGVITDDDSGSGSGDPPDSPQIGFSTPSVSHAEGDSATTAFVYTVTRSGDASAAATVNWAVTGSGANPTDAADFQGGVLPSGALSFAAGETSKTITVSVAGDAVAEPDETFSLTLSGASGAGLGTATATGTITNDDGGGGPPPSGGEVLTSSGPGSQLTGGDGNDTLNASQGNDTLTGGAGADVFVFGSEPWAPIRITDFVLGEDKLDLSALFRASGYTGSHPIMDGYLYVESDGAGGSLLRYDRDGGGSNPQWPNSIIDLQNVSPNGLTWGQLSGGSGAGDGGSGGDGGTNPPPSSGGEVLTASGPGSTLTGGTGDDTLNASQGGDTLTGGAGADVFAFGSEPWAPIHITDFAVGQDKLDLSALLRGSGYTGTDPIADGYVYLESDGAGGTNLRFDHDGGGPNPQWPNTIIDLEHVSPAGLTWAQLSGSGGGAGGDGGGGTNPPPTSGGEVLTSSGPGSTLVGGAGDDTLNASQGLDTLTGGGGADVFVFASEPWAPIHVTDFTPGQDKLDLSGLLRASGYSGTDPIGDGYIYVESDGASGALIRFDHDGGGPNPQWPNTIIDLEGIAPSQVKASDWIIA